MPRTKRPTKKPEKDTDDDYTLKKFNKLVNDQKTKIDNHAQMEIRNIEIAFKMLLTSIPKEYLSKTVGELKSELVIKEATNTQATRHSSQAASHDDGYLTENSGLSQGSEERGAKKKIAVPKSSSRTTGRRSRSADASCRKPPSTASKTMTQRRRSRSVYRTPAFNKNANVNYPAITPKVTPNAPLTLLRQPRQGEMVVSMSGSPVMVPSVFTMQPNTEEMTNCNILLQDGTVLSLQPKELRKSSAYIPFSLMDPVVFGQLKTIKDNIDKVVQLSEKAKK